MLSRVIVSCKEWISPGVTMSGTAGTATTAVVVAPVVLTTSATALLRKAARK